MPPDKFPRIAHLPWSPGGTADDSRVVDVDPFLGRRVVVLEKLDGSNIMFSRDEFFARSHSGAPAHPAFSRTKAAHAALRHAIDSGVAVFLEDCSAVHSIRYSFGLPSYWFVLSVRDSAYGAWWPWDAVGMMARELGLPTPPVLFDGVFRAEADLRGATESLARLPSAFGPDREGVVVSLAEGDPRASYGKDGMVFETVAKWVRPGHVQTDEHWTARQVEWQTLRDGPRREGPKPEGDAP